MFAWNVSPLLCLAAVVASSQLYQYPVEAHAAEL